jgi:hypothetical protein
VCVPAGVGKRWHTEVSCHSENSTMDIQIVDSQFTEVSGFSKDRNVQNYKIVGHLTSTFLYAIEVSQIMFV